MIDPARLREASQKDVESAMEMSAAERLRLDTILNNYRLTPMTLAMKLNPRIIPAPHLMYISTVTAHAIAKGGGRIIISLPPRHGKSELITKNVPIWTLENYGQKNVILCTYGADLSTDFGRKVRDLIQDNQDVLNLRIRKDAERANNWLTDDGGAMMSVGLGGPITGRGADVLVIDDYIKEIKEAQSQTQRDYIWDWFVTTAYTRLEPGATVIIVATRWHYDDLIGRILKNFPGEWTNIVIPALAEGNGEGNRDMLGRLDGEPLFPERYNEKYLLGVKKTLGSFFFNALYQQRPENDLGKLTNRDWIKILRFCPDLSHFRVARIWDLAATEEGGDWMVGTLLAYNSEYDLTIIIDVQRFQLNPLGVETKVAQTALLDGPDVPIYIEREPGSSGKLLVDNYARQALKGYQVEPVPANDGKLIRAQPFLAAAEARHVYLVAGDWNEAWLEEYHEFPGGDHDDQVDTAAIGYSVLSGKKMLSVSWGRATSSKFTSLTIAKAQHNGEGDEGGAGAGKAQDTIILPNGKAYRMSDYKEVSNHGRPLIGGISKPSVVWGRPRNR